jgi:ribosomal protein S18 acetylase RimI-like enzyme
VTIRAATQADLDTIQEFWRAFEDEMGGPAWARETWEEERVDVERRLQDGLVLIAEDDGRAIGYSQLDFGRPGIAWLTSIYVRPEDRDRGVGRALLQGVATASRERGYRDLGLDVLTQNTAARAIYERLGFEEYQRSLAVPIDELEDVLGREGVEPSVGRMYVQTDDESLVERAVTQFMPRLGRSARTEISSPRNGWIEIDDEICSADPKALRRLGQELSYRTGGVVLTLGIEEGVVVRYVLFERGSVADEYASVPEHYGPLPPGDIVGLGANPTVAHRLTGADAERLRAIAVTARSADELMPPGELRAELAEVLGVGSGSEP